MIPLRDDSHGRLFWVGFAVGWAVMGFGVWGVVHTRAESLPVSFAGWTIGAAIVHDFIVAPVVFTVGVALRRRSLRGPVRIGIQAALIVSGMVLAYSFPLLFGYGRRPTNPTVQPDEYLPNALVVLAAIWTAAFAWMLVATRRSRRT